MIARIENGIVKQVVISASVEYANERYGGQWVDCQDNSNVSIGWAWDGENFIQPEIEPIEEDGE